jgi:hypothetical protein
MVVSFAGVVLAWEGADVDCGAGCEAVLAVA